MALHSTDHLRSHLQGALGAANISSVALSLSFLIGIFDSQDQCEPGVRYRCRFCYPRLVLRPVLRVTVGSCHARDMR